MNASDAIANDLSRSVYRCVRFPDGSILCRYTRFLWSGVGPPKRRIMSGTMTIGDYRSSHAYGAVNTEIPFPTPAGPAIGAPSAEPSPGSCGVSNCRARLRVFVLAGP